MALLLGLAISSASGQTVQAGNLIITIDGGVTPKKLPKKTPAPITLQVSGSIKSNDGTHLAALKTLALEFDKNGSINTKGLPTCTVGKLQSTLTAQAKRPVATHSSAPARSPRRSPSPNRLRSTPAARC